MPKQKADKATRPRPQKGGLVLAGIPRVNLLPPSELERRATVALGKRWLLGLLATAAVVSSVVAGAYWVRTTATTELLAEQGRTMTLNTELAGFADVSRSIAEQGALVTFRTDAMGNDTEWRRLFKDLLGALPRGADLRDFNLVSGANPVAEADPAKAIGVIGRLTVFSKDARDLDRLVDNLRDLDIALSADAGSLTSTDGDGYTFLVEFVINQAHYSGDFAAEGGAR